MSFSTSRRNAILAPVALAISGYTGGCGNQSATPQPALNAAQRASNEVAYVFVDVHQRSGDRIDNVPTVRTLFVNTNSEPSPLWVKTPDREKINTSQAVAGTMFTVQPGKYRMVQFSVRSDIFKFSLSESPAEFTVAAGESAYVGSLQSDIQLLNRVNYLNNMRQRVTLRVVDASEFIKPQADRQLARIAGANPLNFRPMTIVRPSFELDSDQLL